MNKYIIIKLTTVILTVSAQIILKISANRNYNSKISEYINPFVIIAYGLSIICTILSTYSLKGINLTLSAVIESLDYIVIPITSCFLLKEKIVRKQYIGIIVILIGFVVFNL